MKSRLVPLAIVLAFAACQRGPNPADLEAERRRSEQVRELDQKIAQLQDLERQATERKVAESERKATESERERQRLEKERQVLLREREQLVDAQKKAEANASSAERKAEETMHRADRERQERTIDLFYTALEPHGEWLEVGQYGYVWQPNEASDPRWRPYTDGRWVFTDYGWTWKSNEPFGWAVYHYGRWTRVKGLGWIWVPGTEWGPGWVSWRRSDRFIGWAPLPPEAWSGSGFNAAVDSYYEIGPSAYTFVPVQEIGQTSYVGRAVEAGQNVTIVNQTVNVTNITYTNVQNNTVVFNGGPALAEVNANATQKVPRLKVERVTDVRSPKELGRAEQRGDTLIMAAPSIASAKVETKPLRVKEQIKTPDVDRGWTDLDKQSAEEARTRITKEAREAESRQRKSVSAQQRIQRAPATPGESSRKAAQPKPADENPAPTVPSRTQLPAATPQGKATITPSGAPPAAQDQRREADPSKPMLPERQKSAVSDPQAKPPTRSPLPATPVPSSEQGNDRTARPTPGKEGAKNATPAPVDIPPGAKAGPDQRPPRQRRGPAAEIVPATPAAAVPATAEPALAPAENVGGATPNRRPPVAKRPRPVTSATPEPMLAPVEAPSPGASTPAATSGVKREGKRRPTGEAAPVAR